jgi:amino acid adenylation domain-containing protein
VINGFQLSPQQIRALEVTNLNREALLTKVVVSISGTLDIKRFNQTITSVCNHFEILRTTLEQQRGMKLPVQVVSNAGHRELVLIEPAMKMGTHCSFPGHLVIVGNNEYSWEFSFSSLILDAQSIPLLLEQISKKYSGQALEKDPLQYPDIAEWGHSLLIEPEAQEGLQFWKKVSERNKMSASNAWVSPGDNSTSLPLNRISKRIPTEIASKIQVFCEYIQVSQEAFFLSTWSLVLLRHGGHSFVELSVENSGRSYDELAMAIGLLAKELPIQVRLDSASSFADLCRQVEKILGRTNDYQEYFSSKTVTNFSEAGFAYRDLSYRSNAMGVDFSLQSVNTIIGPGVHRMLIESFTDGLTMTFRYDDSRLAPEAAQILFDQYFHLAAEAIANSEAAPKDISLLPPVHNAMFRNEFSQGKELLTIESSVLNLIQEQVRHNSQRTAVYFNDEHWSYARLNNFANQVANFLIDQGVKANQRVALFLDRSPELVATILGVMKAGAAYVPIDPSYPLDRIEFMLQDCAASIMITDQVFKENNVNTLTVLSLIDDIATLQAQPTSEPLLMPQGQDLAYIIYTSGSTGQPKGVCVSHHNLAASTQARNQFYSEPPGRFLLLSSYAFDSSVAGIFWTLSTGGSLVLPESGEEKDPYRLGMIIRKKAVNTLLGLPSLYQLLLHENLIEPLNSLRIIIVAGETCSPAIVQSHQSGMARAQLYNEYGPTEATVWSSVWKAKADEVPTRVPIGKPIPGASLFILDDHGNLSPWGVVGELHIGGYGVTLGYDGRADLTEQRFIENRFGDGRLYMTGDLVRWNPLGELEYIGRNDSQVKLRGYRIELGEIEQVMLSLPDISEVAVLASIGNHEDTILCAYFIASKKVDLATLNRSLAAQLPEHMIPQHCVAMDDFPRTPNGKVDKERLPAAEKGRSNLSSDYVEPRNELEIVLCGIWSDILGVEEIGARDNFFELGGTSLLIARVSARIREYFEFNVPLRSLFENLTVEQFAIFMSRDDIHGERLVEVAKLLISITENEVAEIIC